MVLPGQRATVALETKRPDLAERWTVPMWDSFTDCFAGLPQAECRWSATADSGTVSALDET
ncbi:hypothetical protein GCM10009808_13610 [Microbacterium sediminicola]|uniref:Uncharacterized protein n=1 Tax=Microbacterium sediminicola TaxID=415210 RepID=A0ABP4U1S7_9MICO